MNKSIATAVNILCIFFFTVQSDNNKTDTYYFKDSRARLFYQIINNENIWYSDCILAEQKLVISTTSEKTFV